MNTPRKTLKERLATWIAKHSILPATIFTKFQVDVIHRQFSSFWGLIDELPSFKKPSRFSTFTLGAPCNLWTYYFPTITDILAIRERYILQPLQITTKDGFTLCGMHFQDQRSLYHSNTRTLLVFGGNGELYKMGASAWLFKLLQRSSNPFNIIMFDPRECGYSEGRAHAKKLVEDGETVYQYVVHELGVEEDSLDLYGFSLGAAVATLVKANHPTTQGVLISNRSFQSLHHAVKGIFSRLQHPFSYLCSKLASQLQHHAGWDLQPLQAWKSIQSPKMVICHSDDPVISYCASLERGLHEEDLLHTCHHIHLRQKDPMMMISNHHVQPLSFYNDQHGHDVELEILQFLAPQKACYSAARA